MHALFRPTATPPRVGSLLPPERPYLARVMASLVTDVMAYYHHAPKRVGSDHLLCRLLTSLPPKWEMDDRRYLAYLDSVSSNWTRPLGLTSPTHRGKFHETGVTLGKQCHEVVIEHHHGIPHDIDEVGAWRTWQPYQYLCHTRYDLQLPVMNNQLDVKGYGVALLDVPLLALQFRRWQVSQKKKVDQREAIFRFVGGFVLPNTLPSYIDIAVFNRLTRLANHQPLKNHPSPHPFYVTDLSQRVDQVLRRVIDDNGRRQTDPRTFLATTPLLLTDSVLTLCQRLPRMPVTHHNEWAITMARLPYLRYLVDHGIVKDRTDKLAAIDLFESLREARLERVFTGTGSNGVVKLYEGLVQALEQTLADKGNGWWT